MLVSDLLVVLWPGRFWKYEFWVLKENVHTVLKLTLAVELLVRIFRPFPSAYAAARRGMLVVAVVMAALLQRVLLQGTGYDAVVGRVHPLVTDGTVWLFLALGAYCLWYHLPLDSVHKAVLIGLVPYLLVYSVVQRAVVALGWEAASVLNRSAPVAYLALLAYWCAVVWRRTDAGDAGERVGRLVGAR